MTSVTKHFGSDLASGDTGHSTAPPFSRGRDLRAKASLADAKQHNRTLVLQTLYSNGPASRADVARATGLTKVTISSLVSELIDEGLTHELGPRESARPGKPAILLDLDRSALTVACIDLSDHLTVRGALLTIDGDVLARVELPRGGTLGDAAAALAIRLATTLIEQSPRPVLGLGVGTPGIVDDRGVVRTAPNLGWTNLPLQELLIRATDVPVVVANDANLGALAERSFGQASDNFLLINIGHGIGSGVIIDGRLVTGSRFASGEIGQVMVGTDLGLKAPYSRDQVLEHWLSVPSLQRALEDAGPAGRATVLREAGWRLGVALAPVIGVLNVAELVLAGPPELIDGELIAATTEILARRTMPDSHNDLIVRTSAQGDDLVLRGAAATVLQARLGVS